MTKNTYGTGSFVLVNLGPTHPAAGRRPAHHGRVAARRRRSPYAMEGAIFVTGAAIQWLRDGLGIIADAAETGPLAASVPDTGGVVFVPAFTGLGSPWWDPYARGTIARPHARHRPRAPRPRGRRVDGVADRATSSTRSPPPPGVPLAELRVDGGASVMDLLCQFQADVLGVPVRRPAVQETTALGAAYLAGLAEGVWASPADGRGQLDGGGGVHPGDARRRGGRAATPSGAARSSAPAAGRSED